ncbi:hypothetical protein KAM339_042760 (plasmid) [Aeromonas caviae]|nr:hypothetical protein KAM339_042760 [Aeromonas caviae]
MTVLSSKKIQIGVIAAIVLGALGTGIGVYQSVKVDQLTNDLAGFDPIGPDTFSRLGL